MNKDEIIKTKGFSFIIGLWSVLNLNDDDYDQNFVHKSDKETQKETSTHGQVNTNPMIHNQVETFG